MYFAVPKLAYLAISFSTYNVLTWLIDWFRFSIGYFGPSFFALIPQVAVTIWLYLMVKNYKKYNYRVCSPFVVFTLWISSIVIGAAELFFTQEQFPWPASYNALESVGFPILEIHFDGVAPLLGLFHSNQGDLEVTKDWYFDGGVQISWLAFNVIMLLLLVAISRVAYDDLREGRKFDL
jgi:hypothetical protein